MMCSALFLLLWGFVLSIKGWLTYFVIFCENSSSAILLEDSSIDFVVVVFSTVSEQIHFL